MKLPKRNPFPGALLFVLFLLLEMGGSRCVRVDLHCYLLASPFVLFTCGMRLDFFDPAFFLLSNFLYFRLKKLVEPCCLGGFDLLTRFQFRFQFHLVLELRVEAQELYVFFFSEGYFALFRFSFYWVCE